METVKWILSQITAQWSLHWTCICRTGAGLRLFHRRSCLLGTTPLNQKHSITNNLTKMSKKEKLKRTKKQANMYERTRIASHSQLHCIFSGAASIVNININSCSALKSVCEKTIWNEFNFGELHRKHSIQYYILQHFCINLLQLPQLLHSYKSLLSSGKTRASNECYPEACENFTITEKAPTRAFSWLKEDTIKTLC